MINIKSKEDIKEIQTGAKILSAILKKICESAKPGVSTKQLDILAEQLIKENNCKSNFKGYGGYPSVLCTSVNNAVVHGVPSDYILKEGDIVGLDMGLIYKGWHCDMSRTVPIGRVDQDLMQLLKSTKNALKVGIKQVKPGNHFGDIGHAIQNYIEPQGYSVVRDLCGHGIGKSLHEEPEIANYGKQGEGQEIKEGMVFCIEPMINMGTWQVKRGHDGFSFQTLDGKPSAHFEHMVAVTKHGAKILTSF